MKKNPGIIFQRFPIAVGVTIISLLFLMSSCGILIFRKIHCREFSLSAEYYWFQKPVFHMVKFKNAYGQERKFVLVDLSAFHTHQYYSDTGCCCFDISSMLLVNGTDTLMFKRKSDYIEKKKAKIQEELILKWDGEKSVFTSEDLTFQETYSIDSLKIEDIKIFSYKTDIGIRKVVLAKYIGIVQLEMANGEIWTNTELTCQTPLVTSYFKIREDECR